VEQIELTDATYDSCVERMCRAVLEGELVAFPTDTVYGLGGTAFSRKVLEKLLTVKPDRTSKPTAILMDSLIRLSQFGGDVPNPRIVKLAEMYWPGPLTMIWHVAPTIPEEFQGKDKTLGYRIPNSEFLIEVMRRTERPLWATSANLPGRPAPRLYSELDPMVLDACDLVIKTKSLLLGKASSVIDVRGKHVEVLREGAVPAADIEKIWKKA
jgi:L-threonylcarbamoyladenylate synthase